jgi:hypothetical protein
MMVFRTGLVCGAVGILLTAGAAAAYEAEEARAIVVARPTNPPASAERVVLASQRQFDMRGPGEFGCVDHIIWMAGPAGPRDRGSMRWTHRIGVERIWLVEGWVHRQGGGREKIPPDSARTGPCVDAGPGGYPGLADFVVTPPALRPGDVVEVKVEGVITAVFVQKHYIGEHHFGGPDSTIESELLFTFPNNLPLRTWWFGDVPPAVERKSGGSTVARWLLGHLPPEPPWERTISAHLTSRAPSIVGPPVLRYGFPDDWESIAQSRRRLWRIVLRQMPETLMSASQEIQIQHAEPVERLAASLAWVDEHLARLEIPAARTWFEPADMGEILTRGAAIPRDRAAILVWLLRSVAIAAEAATVCSGEPFVEEVALPQQMDTWVVVARPRPGIERWIDLRDGAARGIPLPAGKAFIWTTQPGDPLFRPFPGIDPTAGR